MSVVKLLKRHNNSLASAITHPNIVASALYSRNVITRASLEEASNESKIPSTRAINLLLAVARVLESEPWKFETVLDALKEELDNVSTLLDQIQQEYDDLQKEDNLKTETTHDNGIRHRHTKEEYQQDQNHDEEEEVSTSAIIRVVIKGVGSAMLLSFFMWLVFVVIYKPPAVNLSESSSDKNTGGYPCHSVTPTVAYEELQSEISDSKSLAIHLGLSKVERDIIDRENQSEREKLIEVLHACHDSNECICWEDIISALEKYGNKRKANDIRKKYMK